MSKYEWIVAGLGFLMMALVIWKVVRGGIPKATGGDTGGDAGLAND